MTLESLPLIIEADALEALLDRDDVRIVDLSRPQVYAQYRVPGAVHIDYGQIIRQQPPVGGLLPEASTFAALMSSIGVDADTHVVAYDDEGGGCAARLLYTLQVFGHRRGSMLNGGIHAWANEGHRSDLSPPPQHRAEFEPNYVAERVADAEFIMARLQSDELALLDARSAAEFSGAKAFAARGGHIPGAIHFEWTQGMDQGRNLRLRETPELLADLTRRGFSPERETVVYCQTHHRSAHSFIMLQALGFTAVRGYPGSWSDWGNRAETPVET